MIFWFEIKVNHHYDYQLRLNPQPLLWTGDDIAVEATRCQCGHNMT